MTGQIRGEIRRFSWLSVAAIGMVFGSSCGVSEIRAISAGITAAAQALDGRQNNDVSFGDWLADELRDL